jgi:MATE family multidrug resistance protein
LLAALAWHKRATGRVLAQLSWRPHWDRIWRLIALGLPAAGQIGIEGGLFAVVTVLVAKMDEVSLAAHSITVNVVSTTFMVPLGISSAAAVRVGQAFGRKDFHGVALSGWTAILFGGLFMGSAGLTLGLAPRAIMRVFSIDPAVIASGAVLLQIAALFQLFDGFQVVSTGALRGLGDTRTPMLTHLAGYWAIGLPISYVLCFHFSWGARGIWTGLSIALILIGSTLLMVWRRRVSRLPVGSHAAIS